MPTVCSNSCLISLVLKLCLEIYIHTKMPGGNTHFNSDWLSFKDCNNVLISFWCKKKDTSTAFFNLCNASIQTKNHGLLAFNQHTKTKTHVCLCKDLKDGSQTVITGGKSSNSLVCFSYNDSIIRIDLSIYVVSQNLSYSSCDNVKATLNAMFSGIIPETFSVSSRIKINLIWF